MMMGMINNMMHKKNNAPTPPFWKVGAKILIISTCIINVNLIFANPYFFLFFPLFFISIIRFELIF